MSNRLFQGLVYQMKDAVNRTIGVIDDNGVVIACSELGLLGEVRDEAAAGVMVSEESFVFDGFTYVPFSPALSQRYATFVSGCDEDARRFASLVSVSLSGIKQYYDEKYDRANFIKNVILDNILPGDIYIKANEFHFNGDVNRVAMLIKCDASTDISPYDVIHNLFPDKQKDFVINVSDTDIALVKEVRPGVTGADIENLGASIVDTLGTEFYTHAAVGIGTVVSSVRDLSRSFKEAKVALEVGKVFDSDKSVITYEHLGIARLIYQLPTTLCEMFLNEVFHKGSIEALDQETLFTIQKFFENNLNVSETSRKLFVHRNTLVYRLEKIKKLTGLDLREFDHAIVFKVALMVKKYMDTAPQKY